MLISVFLAVVSAGCAVAAWRLPGSAWARRSPRAGIVVWQLLGLGWGVALIASLTVAAWALPGMGVVQVIALGLAAGLMVMLLSALGWAFVGAVRVRQRQRRLLRLVGRPSSMSPELTLVDHPAATAYCLPGLRSRIVVSAGTISLLTEQQLSALVAHERAHARERHDLVLLPFGSLRKLLPRSRMIGRAYREVELLVEMAADDRARRSEPGRVLAAALGRFGESQEIATRIDRLTPSAQR